MSGEINHFIYSTVIMLCIVLYASLCLSYFQA